MHLGGIVAVTEGYQNTAYRFESAMGAYADAADNELARTMPGQIDISAEVTVRFAIV